MFSDVNFYPPLTIFYLFLVCIAQSDFLSFPTQWNLDRMGPRSSLSHYRIIVFGLKEQWRDGVMTMSDGTCTTVRWRWCHVNGAIVILWWSDALLHHRYHVIAPLLSRHRTIALSTFLHRRCLKKMAKGLHCSLQLLWFIYH